MQGITIDQPNQKKTFRHTVSVYIYTHILYIYTYIYIHMIYVYVHVHVYVYVNVYVYIYTRIEMCPETLHVVIFWQCINPLSLFQDIVRRRWTRRVTSIAPEPRWKRPGWAVLLDVGMGHYLSFCLFDTWFFRGTSVCFESHVFPWLFGMNIQLY